MSDSRLELCPSIEDILSFQQTVACIKQGPECVFSNIETLFVTIPNALKKEGHERYGLDKPLLDDLKQNLDAVEQYYYFLLLIGTELRPSSDFCKISRLKSLDIQKTRATDIFKPTAIIEKLRASKLNIKAIYESSILSTNDLESIANLFTIDSKTGNALSLLTVGKLKPTVSKTQPTQGSISEKIAAGSACDTVYHILEGIVSNQYGTRCLNDFHVELGRILSHRMVRFHELRRVLEPGFHAIDTAKNLRMEIRHVFKDAMCINAPLRSIFKKNDKLDDQFILAMNAFKDALLKAVQLGQNAKYINEQVQALKQLNNNAGSFLDRLSAFKNVIEAPLPLKDFSKASIALNLLIGVVVGALVVCILFATSVNPSLLLAIGIVVAGLFIGATSAGVFAYRERQPDETSMKNAGKKLYHFFQKRKPIDTAVSTTEPLNPTGSPG